MELETVNALVEVREQLRLAQDNLHNALNPVSMDDAVDCFHRAREKVNHALGLVESILDRGR